MADIELNDDAAYEADDDTTNNVEEDEMQLLIEEEAEIEIAIEAEEVEEEDVATIEIAVEPVEDLYPLLDATDPDNPEQQEMYKEYLELLAKIDAQNHTLNTLKEEVRQITCHKSCKTAQDMRHLTSLQVSMAQEQLRLETLLKRAIQLQNNGPARLYGELDLATTFAEDELPTRLCFRPMPMTEQLYSCPSSETSTDE